MTSSISMTVVQCTEASPSNWQCFSASVSAFHSESWLFTCRRRFLCG